jgi:L-alanine-DL-glutamate epimerase-like enolase superfamily enzyme
MYDVQIIAAEVVFEEQPFVKPLILSTGRIERITQATASVRIRANGREITGLGSIYLSDLWAWPDPRFSHEQRDLKLRELTTEIANQLRDLTGRERAHALELGLRLHHGVNHLKDQCWSDIPILARSMCLSPFDAAIHDAAGLAFNRSAFALYGDETPIPSGDQYFRHGASSAVLKSLRASPLQSLPAWIIVGKNDNLDSDLRPWICERGYRCFKLKIMGKDNTVDVARTVDVFNAVRELGADSPMLSIDSNEANPDAASVMDYLVRLRAASPQAFAALQYVEQPTGRDITENAFDWREVTQLKPVLLDEGLTDADLFNEALKQGWSGFALKTCKGHSFALLAAAWALENHLLISLQDLTNPGYSMLHAALFGCYLPTINGVELNSPQFTPAANDPWMSELPGLFAPTHGIHRIKAGTEIGLGAARRLA